MKAIWYSAAALGLAVGLGDVGAALAQKPGGTLRIYHRDTPASASIHEEATVSANLPFMALYNNLVIYDQQKKKNTMDTIVPDLAKSWAWDDTKTKLTFKLNEGVKWHDGKPFSSADVKCTFDLLLGKSKQRLRKNPRSI
jgi:peptide/nickel transport system substrate-binding protein